MDSVFFAVNSEILLVAQPMENGCIGQEWQSCAECSELALPANFAALGYLADSPQSRWEISSREW